MSPESEGKNDSVDGGNHKLYVVEVENQGSNSEASSTTSSDSSTPSSFAVTVLLRPSQEAVEASEMYRQRILSKSKLNKPLFELKRPKLVSNLETLLEEGNFDEDDEDIDEMEKIWENKKDKKIENYISSQKEVETNMENVNKECINEIKEKENINKEKARKNYFQEAKDKIINLEIEGKKKHSIMKNKKRKKYCNEDQKEKLFSLQKEFQKANFEKKMVQVAKIKQPIESDTYEEILKVLENKNIRCNQTEESMDTCLNVILSIMVLELSNLKTIPFSIIQNCRIQHKKRRILKAFPLMNFNVFLLFENDYKSIKYDERTKKTHFKIALTNDLSKGKINPLR